MFFTKYFSIISQFERNYYTSNTWIYYNPNPIRCTYSSANYLKVKIIQTYNATINLVIINSLIIKSGKYEIIKMILVLLRCRDFCVHNLNIVISWKIIGRQLEENKNTTVIFTISIRIVCIVGQVIYKYCAFR